MTLTTNFNFAVHWDHTETDGANRETVDRNALAIIKTLINGTAIDQADRLFHERRTITSGNSYAYDLAGVLLDQMGAVVTFARIKALVIVSLATADAAQLDVGGAAANAWVSWVNDATNIVTVMAGGVMILFAPGATAYEVVAGTADQLKVAAVGADVEFDIAIVGASV